MLPCRRVLRCHQVLQMVGLQAETCTQWACESGGLYQGPLQQWDGGAKAKHQNLCQHTPAHELWKYIKHQITWTSFSSVAKCRQQANAWHFVHPQVKSLA